MTLITGATGFLGRQVLSRLLTRDPRTQLLVLVRANDDAVLHARWAQVVRRLAPHHRPRVRPLRGDITRPRLGLSPEAYEGIARELDRVVHVAATTRMDLPLAEARRINVSGTASLVQVCRDVRRDGRRGRLDYVSTAYVAGDRDTIAYEDELDVGQSFRNSYERSKCEAERLCREASTEMPVVIHRPSIIVGDSATGRTDNYRAFYGLLSSLVRFYDRGRRVLTRFVPLPLAPECLLDLVPVDYVADSIATLYDRVEAEGHCYHLAAGNSAIRIADVTSLVCAHFAVAEPRYLSSSTLASLRRVIAWCAGTTRRGPWRRVNVYLPYATRNPSFDTANARAAGLTPPPVREYFTRLLAYAYDTDFGRRQSAEADRAATSPRVPGETPRRSLTRAVEPDAR
jgi:thioester reductase-like protein